MSLSNPTLQNPAEHFFEIKNGTIQFYDKDKQERISIPYPFGFIELDQLHTVTGWSDQDQSGVWSNEIKSLREDLTVRTKRGVKYVGPYKSDQGINQVASFGGRYTKSIYIAHKNKAGELILGNLKLTGAALTAWIEFGSSHRTEGNWNVITGTTEGKKGATTYQIPVFEFKGKPTDEELAAAVELDRTLQNYLAQYLTAPKFDDNAEPISEDAFEEVGTATPEQIADFEARKADKLADKQEDRAIQETFQESEPINLDDIPF